MLNKYFYCIFITGCLFSVQQVYAYDPGKPLIFPIPSDVKMHTGKFDIDKNTFILLPEKASKEDEFAASFLRNEIVDKYHYVIRIIRSAKFTSSDKFILIGSTENFLIKNYCKQNRLFPALRTLGDEGYMLSVSNNAVVVVANTHAGVLYGVQSLRQVIYKEDGKIFLPQLVIKDSPAYPFRGIKLYLPGKENIQFFKRFIKDFAALYKFNKIILELNANMRLDKHPELNIGAIQFARHLNFSRLDRPPGIHMEYQNSSHQDNADGQILEKEDVADIVKYIRSFDIEVIPELPSLTHSYYLLAGHEELAENMNQPYPDTYCPLKPAIYKIYFDVLDEYIDVIHPKMIHVGHDEWRMEKDVCELCRGKDYGELYGMDLKKIHDHLAAKNIKTAIWGDHILEAVTEKDHQSWKSSTGYQYKIPGALRPEQVVRLIPKDILIFNWFWDKIDNDTKLSAFGFKQVYGNFRANINNWDDRDKIKGVLGGAPSSWAATTEYNIGKDQLIDFLGAANLLWSKNYLTVDTLAFITERLVTDVYKNLSGKILPSENGAVISSLDISSYFNSSLPKEVSQLKSGATTAIVVDERIATAKVIDLDKDVSSIIFLHACTKEANNDKAYSMIYNFDDTAEPLGWYEIVYEDGLIEIVPVRYGVNILDWKCRQRIISNESDNGKYNQNKYAYNATPVECSKDNLNPVTFFSFEWKNTRFGKKIKEINLKSVNYKKGRENAIMLLAVSISENKEMLNAKGSEKQ